MPRPTYVVDTPIKVSAQGGPLQAQIYTQLRRVILSGGFGPGGRLPSSRHLASQLVVSRTTVNAAYEQLVTEGFIAGAAKRGFFVQPGVAQVATDSAIPNRTRLVAAKIDTPIRPFEPGISNWGDFPWSTWASLVRKRILTAEDADRSYGDPLGHTELRRAVRDHIGAARGIRCGIDQIVIVSGAQSGLFLCAGEFAGPSAKVWMEDPGYLGARRAFTAAGATPVPVPVDEEGLRVGEGRRRARSARLAYVTPSHQYPMGMVLSARRRVELLEWAQESGAAIIEDDYDAEFRHEGPSLSTLRTLAAETFPDVRVLYVGTFSKTLFPALRVGYVIAPSADLARKISERRVAIDRGPPSHDQAALADFLQHGHYARWLRRMRRVYSERRRLLVTALQDSGLLDQFDIAGVAAGLHVAVVAKSSQRLTKLARLCNEQGLTVATMRQSTLGEPELDGLLLGYGAGNDREFRRAVKKLGLICASSV